MAKKKSAFRKKVSVKTKAGKARKASKKARRPAAAGVSVFEKKAAGLLARLWTQPEFKAAFLSSPADVLKREGFDVPEGTRISVQEDTPDVMHVVIPQPPAEVTVETIGKRLDKACRTCLCFTGATRKGR